MRKCKRLVEDSFVNHLSVKLISSVKIIIVIIIIIIIIVIIIVIIIIITLWHNAYETGMYYLRGGC